MFQNIVKACRRFMHNSAGLQRIHFIVLTTKSWKCYYAVCLQLPGWWEDFMFDNDHFAASQYLITSASSKTSIALALTVRERGTHRSIGLTSAGNKSFVENLGCYDQVVSYDQVDTLDPQQGSILVDMAGSAKTTAELHTYFNDSMLYSCKIGATHIAELGGPKIPLAGAKPEFFFAPTQMGKRAKEWGPAVLQQRIAQSLLNFMEFSKASIEVIPGDGAEAVNSTFQKVLAGTAPPSQAYTLSLSQDLTHHTLPAGN